ncbi:MAG: acyl-CoA synthetase [Wenzhouxiangella sp.]|nr:MAG: acyl-CoA synthetase [Wenzhouxiangella sp.]
MTDLPLMTRSLNEPVALHLGQPVSAAQFIGQAQTLAGAMPGDGAIVNLCQDRYAFGLALAAALLAGRTTLLPANRLPATIDDLLRDHPDSMVISDHFIEGLGHRQLDISAMPDCRDPADQVPRIPADLLAVIVFTSGSTGPASRVLKPWRTLHDSGLINAAEYGPGPELTHLVATVPPQHMWGLETTVLMPWFAPVVIVSGQPFFAADILALISELPRPRALVSTPVHLRNLVECPQPLVPIDRIYSATAPLSQSLARQLESDCPGRLTEVYGCSEAGCLARREPVREQAWRLFQAFTLVRIGPRFRVEAAHLPEAVTLLDRLELHGDGRFQLIGRDSDLVNVAGKRASLSDLTQTLLDIDGVLDGIIFQPPESDDGRVARLAALVVAPGLKASELRRALARRIDPAFMPRPLRLVESLPRAESGKLPRQSLVSLYEQVCETAG